MTENIEKKKRSDSKLLVLRHATRRYELISSHTSFSAACKAADKAGDGTYIIATVRQIRSVKTETEPRLKVKLVGELPATAEAEPEEATV